MWAGLAPEQPEVMAGTGALRSSDFFTCEVNYTAKRLSILYCQKETGTQGYYRVNLGNSKISPLGGHTQWVALNKPQCSEGWCHFLPFYQNSSITTHEACL